MQIRSVRQARRFLLVGIAGTFLTWIGDMLIGCVQFPENAGLIEGYFAAALSLPVWRPIGGGLIGFLGISMEFPGLMTVYPLLRRRMPRAARFYRFSMYVYLAVAGGAVHLPCGVFMWLYRCVTEAAGQAVGYAIALRYALVFLLPVTVFFMVFFVGSSVVQFIAFAKARTPFPRGYAVFNLLWGSVFFNALRRLGNHAIINGIGTSNKSLAGLVMFIALYVGYGKYVSQEDLS